MKKGGGSESTIISRSVLVYTLHSLEKCPGPCSISGVCAEIITIISSFNNKVTRFQQEMGKFILLNRKEASINPLFNLRTATYVGIFKRYLTTFIDRIL